MKPFNKTKVLSLILLNCLLLSSVNSQILPSYRIFPNEAKYQVEPSICISPLNRLVMFCSAYTVDQGVVNPNNSVYVSTNGGLNWSGSDVFISGNFNNNHGRDPGVAIDKNGVFILKDIGFINLGIFVYYSTNMGANWSNAFQIIGGSASPEDKGTLTTDDISSSPYYGRSYTSWVSYTSSTPPVLFSYTTNSGLSWSSYSIVNPSNTNRCSGGDVKIGPNGQVYDCWAGVNPAAPFNTVFGGFASSSNGGTSWSVSQNIFTMNGIVGQLPQKNYILVNGVPRMAVDLSGGPRNGWIYIVSSEINNPPAGSDPDILFHRSTNGGQSWSLGIRVNQDPNNNGKIQYFPAICVDSTGAINVLYYDDRNTSSDSTDVFISRSTDGGNNWYDFAISDKRFKPVALPGAIGFQGDFISIVSSRNKLFPVWMANYTGTYQVWTTIIDISTIGIQQISSRVPQSYSLSQNYPNPFNPSTTIEFSVPKRESIKLIIYDLLGKEITTLVNSELNPGTYKTVFEANNLSSGIYFYSLQTENFKETKRMILVK